jgi:hypothetical protein
MSLLNQASLIVVPSGYKEGTLYSAKPINGDGDLSFTRATNGTRINSEGLVEVTPWNLLEYSEQFTSAAWATSNGATVSADQTTAPNGTTTADKIVFPANSAANIYNFPTSPVGANNISVYAKTLSGTKQFRLRIDTGSGPAVSSDFTATTEWQRFDFAVTTTAANLVVYIFNDSTGVAGDLYVWGAQLNIGATAKPYFPTTDRLNVPRLTYPVGGGCPSLLLEKQSTNLVTYSEDLTNAAWTKTNSTVTANTTTSPDGTLSADKMVSISANTGAKRVEQTFSAVLGTTYTVSAYFKADGWNFAFFNAPEAQFTTRSDLFLNLTNGTLSGSTSLGSVESIGNGWYRLKYTRIATASGSTSFRFGFSDTASISSTGDGTSGVYLWGAQIEAGTYATSYIPTYGSSVTRSADSCSKTGISSLIGQSEGVVYVEYDQKLINQGITRRIFALSDGTTSNRITAYINSANGIDFYVRNSGGDLFLDQASSPIGNTKGVHKIAAAYKNGDYAVYLDGVQIISGAGTAGTIPSCSRFDLGSQIGSNNLYEPMMQSLLFPTRLTNTELADLTTI